MPITRPSAASTRAGRWSRHGRGPASSTSRGCRGSCRTAPPADMPRISGTCRCAGLRRADCRSRARSAGRPAEFGLAFPIHSAIEKTVTSDVIELARGCHDTAPGACSAKVDKEHRGNFMLTRTPHLFDDATRVTAGDSRWTGRTSDDYWAFVGPFGGATAATILRALMHHSQRAGDPLSLTVNFCAPIAQGAFDLGVRLVKANRSTQHWSVELTQGGTEVATLATAIFAERRPSWSHQQAEFPEAPPFEQILPYPKVAASWVKQYDFRFVEGGPCFSGGP